MIKLIFNKFQDITNVLINNYKLTTLLLAGVIILVFILRHIENSKSEHRDEMQECMNYELGEMFVCIAPGILLGIFVALILIFI